MAKLDTLQSSKLSSLLSTQYNTKTHQDQMNGEKYARFSNLIPTRVKRIPTTHNFYQKKVPRNDRLTSKTLTKSNPSPIHLSLKDDNQLKELFVL